MAFQEKLYNEAERVIRTDYTRPARMDRQRQTVERTIKENNRIATSTIEITIQTIKEAQPTYELLR